MKNAIKIAFTIFLVFGSTNGYAFECKEGQKEAEYVNREGVKVVIDCEGVYEEQKRVDERQEKAIRDMKENERYLMAEGKY